MSDITKSITITLKHEGGYVNNPNDSGGATNFGITQKDMPGVDMKTITQDQAIEYYREHYVKALYTSITSQVVLDKLFDLGVLFGVGTVIKVIQGLLGVTQDGNFGPDTLAKLNAKGDGLLQPFKTAMVNRALDIVAKNPKDREFFAGWVKRINS